MIELGNALPELWYTHSAGDYEYTRMVRGGITSVQRDMKTKVQDYTKDAGFRIALRPIIDQPYCDLDDPWLNELGINILG